ncbi:MAG: mercuric transporter MerT family protein [Candidatus Neomarinimicrobiota bacterium]
MKGTLLSSVLAGLAASFCCIGPALILLFGSTTLGAFSFLEPIRPYTSTAAIGLLGFAYIRTYRKKSDETCCDIEEKEKLMKNQKLQRRALLGITPVVLALILFPYSTGLLYAGDKPENEKSGVTSEWTVEGMTCQWCARGLEGGISSVEGVSRCEVDYDSQSMICTLDEDVLKAKAVPALVKEMGYAAVPKKQKETTE